MRYKGSIDNIEDVECAGADGSHNVDYITD